MDLHPETIQKILNDMSKEELIVLIECFEHYPTVTKNDDIDFILAYLNDESCSISKVEIEKYLNNHFEFTLNSENALDAVLNGKTVLDNHYGYIYRYPTQEEIELFCNSNEIIRTRKCDTTTITFKELHNYSDFMGFEAKFKIISKSEILN